MTLISKNPDDDNTKMKRGIAIQSNNLPFRKYFIDGRGDVILKILMNCFTALKQVLKKEWENPANNVLWKTTGYGAIIKAFPYLHERGVDKKDLSENYIYECFNNLKVIWK